MVRAEDENEDDERKSHRRDDDHDIRKTKKAKVAMGQMVQTPPNLKVGSHEEEKKAINYCFFRIILLI